MEKFLLRANKYIPNFIFPNYSSELFLSDLDTFPVQSNICYDVLRNYPNANYLDFFKLTRGFERPGSTPNEDDPIEVKDNIEFKNKIWEIFSRGSLMLYFENLFIRIVNSKVLIHKNKDALLSYLKMLSENPVSEWDKIVSNLGCYCYEFFSNEPELYLDLFENFHKDQNIENMTDFEILKKINYKLPLGSKNYPNMITRKSSRSDLIKFAKNIKT